MHLEHISRMKQITSESAGFDVLIIVVSTKEQEEFWSERLRKVKDQIAGRKSRIYCVVESWEAGQLLGTLNAWMEVCRKEDLDSLVSSGGKVAIYHTAGRGKRIAPLSASEGNNKAALKLPKLMEIDGEIVPMTLLEAVIYQSSIFAPSRDGRICVFWTDQIFIPSGDVGCEGNSHVELFSIREDAPDNADDWKNRWQSYGLVVPAEHGSMVLEKQTWNEFRSLVDRKVIRPVDGKTVVGRGLGCFSVSYEFFREILEEFRRDLEERKKLDTDPDLWMPLTAPDFVEGDKRKRIQEFKRRFESKDGRPIFADKDLGRGTYWWDFGQLGLYHGNLMKLFDESDEGRAMRRFFEVESGGCISLKSNVSGDLRRCIVVDSDVRGKLDGCIVVSSKVKEMNARNSIIYNCIELSKLELEDDVIADIFHPEKGKIRMRTKIWRDGKKDWNERISQNPYSYEELEKLMQGTSRRSMELQRKLWENYFSLDLGKKFDELKHSIIRFLPNLVEKVWGGDLIERFKGIKVSGRPIGESWECSGHPSNPSRLKVGGLEIPLIHLLNHCADDIIGERFSRKFRGEFPILLKFIGTRENLSVQVHPSEEDAKRLGERDHGKNEAWYVIDAEPGARVYLGLRENVDDLSKVEERNLNSVEVRKGDVFFIPAGTLHAVGKGLLLFEIQETSDLTYRVWDWNRHPPRELHLDKARKVANLRAINVDELRRIPVDMNGEKMLVDTIHFSLTLVERSGEHRVKGSFNLLTCIDGEAEVQIGERRERIKAGETALIPACVESYRLSCRGKVLKSFLRTL